jgi:hypothetical protein
MVMIAVSIVQLMIGISYSLNLVELITMNVLLGMDIIIIRLSISGSRIDE